MVSENTQRILLVDGQQDWLAFAEAVLKGAGFEVVTALDIRRAQRLLSTAQDDFALILVDLDSAEEDTAAFRQVAWAQSGYKRPLVVLFPTELTPVNMSKFFRLGAFDCVSKQYGKRGLLNLVKQQLADYQAMSKGSSSSFECGKERSSQESLACTSTKAQPLPSFVRLARALNMRLSHSFS